MRATARSLDRAFLDGGAAVELGRPASILHGIDPLSAGSPSSIEDDVSALLLALRHSEPEQPVFIASLSGVLWLARQRAADGSRLFEGVSASGGNLLGVPLLVTPAAEDRLVAVDASAILFADQGVDIAPAHDGTLQFSSTPGAGPQTSISLFQTGTIALRATRYVTWMHGTDDAAAYVTLPLATGSPA